MQTNLVSGLEVYLWLFYITTDQSVKNICILWVPDVIIHFSHVECEGFLNSEMFHGIKKLCQRLKALARISCIQTISHHVVLTWLFVSKFDIFTVDLGD